MPYRSPEIIVSFMVNYEIFEYLSCSKRSDKIDYFVYSVIMEPIINPIMDRGSSFLFPKKLLGGYDQIEH